MWLVPTYAATVSRRRLLVGAATLVALTVTVAGCGSAPPPPDLDDLTTALDRARSDSRLATETAERTRGPVAQALEAVAAERSAHAEALADEIVRLTGQAAPTTSVTAGTTTATSSTSSVADPPPTVDDVIGALRTSAESATTSAAVLSGYRAGLLGSIAAACTAAYTVALVPLGETP
ncbi:MAG: hypothetical protein SW019_16805 [Actinomycetota bacterium]|nr:hypothetical protein [Actinomycetota bacterium]